MENDTAARLKAKQEHFKVCKEAYQAMKKYTGTSEVKDTSEDLAAEEDTDGDALMKNVGEEANKVQEEVDLPALHVGSYVMEPSNLRCLIYKPVNADPETFKMFHLLESVRHRTLIRHHAFYEETHEGIVLPRIVLSSVDYRFSDLLTTVLTTRQASEMFFSVTKSGASLQEDLVTMILDLCSGLEHLFSLGLYPPKIDLGDLYLCKDGPKNYHVQLLILKVDKLTGRSAKRTRMAELWTQLQEIVEKIRKATKTDELNGVHRRFISYIGHDVSALAQYPHSWSYDQKGCYLMSIISADAGVVREKLKKSIFTGVLKWAIDDDTGCSPKLIDKLIDHDKKRSQPSNYILGDPYDYLKLCRSTYKHHPEICKKVPELKDMCPLREDVLKKMEKWEPLIWCILYDAIGLIGSLPTSAKSVGSG